MAAYTIVYRSVKGAPLTNTEVDNNFQNLDTFKAPVDNPSFTTALNVVGPISGQAAQGALVATNGSGAGQTSIWMKRVGAPVDQKEWEILTDSTGGFGIRAINDAYSASTYLLQGIRGTSYTISTLQLMGSGGNVVVGNGTGDGVSNFQVIGSAAFGGTFKMTAAGAAMEIGSVVTAGTPYIDFHSSGNAVDYDSRIIASGGSATTGLGTLTYVSQTHIFNIPSVIPTVFIGQSTNDAAGGMLQVAGDINATQGKFTATRYGNSGAMRLRSTGGTFASPTASSLGANLMSIIASGFDGLNFQDVASMDAVSEATITSVSAPARIQFSTTPVGSVIKIERARIAPSGAFLIGSTIDDGINNLQVGGTIKTNTGYAFPDGSIQGVSIGKNRLINGDCRVTQRVPIVAAAGVGGYGGPDRFAVSNGSTGQFTQATSSMTYNGVARPCLLQTVNTAVGSLTGTNNWQGIVQQIEGTNCFDLMGQQVTASFLFSTNVSGVYSVALEDAGGAHSVVSTFTAVANTPQRVVITFPALPTNLAISNNAQSGLYFRIGFLNQATYSTSTLNTWQTGNFSCASTSTNWAATAGNFISATDMQLEVGTVATTFDRRSYAHELMLCQRYYQVLQVHLAGYQTAGLGIAYGVMWQTPMRTSPTVTFNGGTYSNSSSLSAINPNTVGARIQAVATATGAAAFYDWQMIASAEL